MQGDDSLKQQEGRYTITLGALEQCDQQLSNHKGDSGWSWLCAGDLGSGKGVFCQPICNGRRWGHIFRPMYSG